MENNLTLDSVLPANKPLFLKLIANLSVGGTSSDATELVHPDNIFMAERIAKIVDLDICGMDIISPDIGVPLNLNGASVVEVNSAPGIRLHLEPTEGKPRNVAGSIIDMLFPEDNAWRIPIIAVAGTGNTIVCDLAAAMFTQIGQKVGCATSKGIYSQNVLIAQGDCTHYKHAELVLKDPMVDFAIFECGLSSILENGLAFYNCDIGIVVNIAKDGFVGNTQDMQKAAYLVPACVLPTGYAILNADDEAVYNMHKGLKCNIAYFSMHRNNPIIIDHIKNGGLAAMVEDGFFTVCDGMDKIKMMEVDELSDLSGNGKINIVQNILAFILVGWICKIETFVMKTLFEGYLKNQ